MHVHVGMCVIKSECSCVFAFVCVYVCLCTLILVPLCACVYANLFKTVSVYGTNIASTQTGCSIFTDIIAMAAGERLFFLFFTWQNTESNALPVLFRICPRLVCQKKMNSSIEYFQVIVFWTDIANRHFTLILRFE